MYRLRCIPVAVLAAFISMAATAAYATEDPRRIASGYEIPSIAYADQPYIVVLGDGTWLCTLTTGLGHEGKKGQHIIAARSSDRGETWSEPVAIEPPSGPSASWACPLLTDFGRVYVFYTYNGDEVDLGRNDTHGWYAYKYSDDGGLSWCEKTQRLPYRLTACDTYEKDGQIVTMFWGICKPIAVDGTVFFSFSKLHDYFLIDSEGWLFRSDNILTERDPAKIHWAMLPEGEKGIRHPDYGSVQEEHNLAALSTPGELACVYRTTLGHPAISYSRDGGVSWPQPEPMRYTPGGRIIRNPRACPKIWRCDNGKFLFWFHNHGGLDFNGRNPAWIVGGIEKEGFIHWSQPEILLYHDDPDLRMSYPDLIEVNGEYYVTETQKEVARVHHIDKTLLEGMWAQVEGREAVVARKGLLLDARREEASAWQQEIPTLPSLAQGGFTLECFVRLPEIIEDGTPLLDTRTDSGRGVALLAKGAHSIAIEISDGTCQAVWDVDPGLLQPDTTHHVVFIVDGAADIISVVVDGQLCDGHMKRQWGFGRIAPEMDDVNGASALRLDGAVRALRIHGRYLRTSEAVGNYRVSAAAMGGSS